MQICNKMSGEGGQLVLDYVSSKLMLSTSLVKGCNQLLLSFDDFGLYHNLQPTMSRLKLKTWKH